MFAGLAVLFTLPFLGLGFFFRGKSGAAWYGIFVCSWCIGGFIEGVGLVWVLTGQWSLRLGAAGSVALLFLSLVALVLAPWLSRRTLGILYVAVGGYIILLAKAVFLLVLT